MNRFISRRFFILFVPFLLGLILTAGSGNSRAANATPTNLTDQDSVFTDREVLTGPETPAAGDVEEGKALFLGRVRFEAGSAPCAACHTAGPDGALGGKTLAADLTTVFEDMGGAEGLSEILDNPEFPVMAESYRGKTFTVQEKEDLIAFFAGLGEAEPPPAGGRVGKLEIFGALGMLLLFGFMAFVKPRQKDMFEILRRKS